MADKRANMTHHICIEFDSTHMLAWKEESLQVVPVMNAWITVAQGDHMTHFWQGNPVLEVIPLSPQNHKKWPILVKF